MASLQEPTAGGMHGETLRGRTQQRFFLAEEGRNLLSPGAFEVSLAKRAEIDAAELAPQEINLRIRRLMNEGHGTITLKNPGAKHSVAVGILNRLNLHIEGSL